MTELLWGFAPAIGVVLAMGGYIYVLNRALKKQPSDDCLDKDDP